MSAGMELLTAAFAEAANPGAELVPGPLLDVIAALDDPLRGLLGDPGGEMFAAIRAQFPFVNIVRGSNQQPSADDLDRLAALFRWTIREYREWQEADDSKLRKLTALFVVAWFSDADNTFWNVFPVGLESNGDLLAALERMVSRFDMTLSTPGSMVPPIWESEAIEAFRKADESGDWVGIANGWRQIEQAIFPNVIISNTVRCLGRFGFNHLLQAISDRRQTVVAMAIVQTLPITRALEIGAATDNPYIQFAVAYQATGRRGASELDGIAQDLLTTLLIKVASDEPRWAAWMKIFNRISAWYPALQIPLGRALAVIKQPGLSAYIDTIDLVHTGMSHTAASGGRKNVTVCLRAFRDAAPARRRKLLWRLAFERWQAWRFGGADPDDHLVEVSTSELDYAVAGYARECLSDAKRQEVILSLWQKLNEVEDLWHGDIVACMSEWNRIISECQPFAHAENAAQRGGDWQSDTGLFLPFDPQTSPYVLMKFGMRLITPASAQSA